jgi:hypothetical protein
MNGPHFRYEIRARVSGWSKHAAIPHSRDGSDQPCLLRLNIARRQLATPACLAASRRSSLWHCNVVHGAGDGRMSGIGIVPSDGRFKPFGRLWP